VPVGPGWRYERLAWRAGYAAVAGLDEAGRGCLAGPVVAAAVVLDPSRPIPGVDDSKRLTPARRAAVYDAILLRARCWVVGLVGARQIDRANILVATRRATKVTRDRYMLRADGRYPGYGFARHKGYGTSDHIAALRLKGATPLHRQTFRGVADPPPRLPFC
jgi:ribonuclease HII